MNENELLWKDAMAAIGRNDGAEAPGRRFNELARELAIVAQEPVESGRQLWEIFAALLETTQELPDLSGLDRMEVGDAGRIMSFGDRAFWVDVLGITEPLETAGLLRAICETLEGRCRSARDYLRLIDWAQMWVDFDPSHVESAWAPWRSNYLIKYIGRAEGMLETFDEAIRLAGLLMNLEMRDRAREALAVAWELGDDEQRSCLLRRPWSDFTTDAPVYEEDDDE